MLLLVADFLLNLPACPPSTSFHLALPLPLPPQIVLLLDADFLPNRALTDLIHQPEMYEQLRRVTGGWVGQQQAQHSTAQ